MAALEFVPNHGHTIEECRALSASQAADEAWLAGKGLSLSLSTDFAALRDLSDSQRDAGYGVLMPIYDPAHEEIGPDNGFWVCARRGDGTPVAVMAGRLRDVKDLLQALRDNTFLMGPTPPAGASCVADLEGIDGLKGRMLYIGALWVHPAAQGAFLSKLMVRCVVRIGFYRWTPCRMVALVDEKHIPLARKIYTFRQIHGGMKIKDPRWQFPLHCALLTISEDEVRRRFIHLQDAA